MIASNEINLAGATAFLTLGTRDTFRKSIRMIVHTTNGTPIAVHQATFTVVAVPRDPDQDAHAPDLRVHAIKRAATTSSASAPRPTSAAPTAGPGPLSRLPDVGASASGTPAREETEPLAPSAISTTPHTNKDADTGAGWILRDDKGQFCELAMVTSWVAVSPGDRLVLFFAMVWHQDGPPVPMNEALREIMAAHLPQPDAATIDAQTYGELVAVYNLTQGTNAVLRRGVAETVAGANLGMSGLGFGLLVAGCAGMASAVPSLGVSVSWDLVMMAPVVAGAIGFALRTRFPVDKERLLEQAIADEARSIAQTYIQARQLLMGRAQRSRKKAHKHHWYLEQEEQAPSTRSSARVPADFSISTL